MLKQVGSLNKINRDLKKDLVVVEANLTEVQREIATMALDREKKRIHEGLFGKKGFMNVMSSKQHRREHKIMTHLQTGK